MKTINQKTEEDNRKRPGRKKIMQWLLLLLLIVSLVFYRDSLQEISEGICQVTAGELCVSILLAVAGYLAEGLTIACMMGTVQKVGFFRRACKGAFIAFVCEFYRLATLGNGSGFAEILYLHREGIEPGSATVLTMVQYVMKRIAIVMMGILGFCFLCYSARTGIFIKEYTVFVGTGCFITAVVILVFLCLALSPGIGAAALRLLDGLSLKIPSQEKRFSKWKEQIGLLNRSGKQMLGQKKRMLCAVILQTIKLFMFYGIPACLLYGQTDLTAGECVFIMALAFMLAGIIPAPSGAGSLEFTFLLFFTHFVEAEAAVPAILVFRFATWICPAAAGGGLLLTKKIIRKKTEIL